MVRWLCPMRDPEDDSACSTRIEHAGGVGGCGRCVLWMLSKGNEDCHGGASVRWGCASGRWGSVQNLLQVGIFLARYRD